MKMFYIIFWFLAQNSASQHICLNCHGSLFYRKGDVLTSEQARILKLLGREQAEFRLRMVAVWANDGSFTALATIPTEEEEEEEEENMSDNDE
jgi:hypothetical protein